jgi:hypothetical protein
MSKHFIDGPRRAVPIHRSERFDTPSAIAR